MQKTEEKNNKLLLSDYYKKVFDVFNTDFINTDFIYKAIQSRKEVENKICTPKS